MITVVEPRWDAPKNVVAFTTTRHGGVSVDPCAALNLADHVDDNIFAVNENRRRLRQELSLPMEPRWMRQVHGADVLNVEANLDLPTGPAPTADAAICTGSGGACAVLTADCLPIFLADVAGVAVGVAHAGWRGIAAGVIERVVAEFPAQAAQIKVAFGPVISGRVYEVGAEVLCALGVSANDTAYCRPSPRAERWYLSLQAVARARLARLGVDIEPDVAAPCTFSDRSRWFSHRRDGPTGRIASIIYRS